LNILGVIMSRNLSFIFTLIFAFILVSCGGGSDDDSLEPSDVASSKPTGTVGILLTDKPADPKKFSAINASIEKIELLGDDDSESVILFSGETKTLDLLKLKHESIPFTFREDVETGTYCKIRLILSDLELVLRDDTPEDMSDNETYHPDLPGNGKLDLISRDCFKVEEDKVITVQLDMDAGKSIHINKNKKGYKFRPVVYVDVLNKSFQSKLVRLKGEVTEIDSSESTFTVCGAIPMFNADKDSCASVFVGENTAFFDNVDFNGTPRPLEEFLLDSNIGQEINLVGYPRHQVVTNSTVSVKVPPGHYPEKGLCRLWEIGVPPGLQSPPGDCEELKKQVTTGYVLVNYKGVIKTKQTKLMMVDALVIELGEYLKVEGEVTSAVEESVFSLDVVPGGSIIFDEDLQIEIQQGDETINGTRIVSKDGRLIDVSLIDSPKTVSVDGVLDLRDDSTILRSALVIVDVEISASQQVTGIVLTNEDTGMTIDPEADIVCGTATDNLNVMFGEKLKLLSVVITDEGSEISPGGEIATDKTVGINGYCKEDGFYTNNVVIIDDQRI